MPRGPGPALQLVTEAEAKAAFDVFDTDKSGGITRDEFKAVLTFATGTGTELSAANVDELFGSLEFNQDGKRNISELAAALASGAAPMPAAVGADKYFGCEALLETVESGAIAPLSGRWLVQQWEAGGGRFPEHERDSDGHPTPKVKTPGSPSTFRLARRQDLPPEAFVPPATLRRWVGALGDDWALVFVALSYRWLSAKHPDPDGFHTAIVAEVARLYLESRMKGYPSALQKAFTKHGLDGKEATDFALFWDFGSLHQKPREPEEDALFGAGLKASNVWYGHTATTCWMQSELPPGKAVEFEAAGLAPTYEGSGWCFVEAAISAAVKAGSRRLDLERRTAKALRCAYGPEPDLPEWRLDGVCTASRLPPPTPKEVARLLKDEKKFTGKGDVPIVTELYRAFFETVAATTTRLDFHQLEWGAAEAASLATVLPQFGVLAELDLSENKLGAEGAKDVAEALRVNASLTSVSLLGNKFDEETAEMLLKVKEAKPTLATLCGLKPDQTEAAFNGWGLGPADARLLAPEIGVSASLTSVCFPTRELTHPHAARLTPQFLRTKEPTTPLPDLLPPRRLTCPKTMWGPSSAWPWRKRCVSTPR